MSNHDRVLVIGGGIGGLATARALQLSGIDCAVFERVEEFRPVGAGLSLWSNAVKALRLLDLEQAVIAAGETMQRSQLRAAGGEVLTNLPMAELERRSGAPTVAIHRADLQSILLNSLSAGTVRLGAECTAFEQGTEGVTARFADDTEATGSLIIGADGLHSIIRSQLFGESRPRYSGYTAWRAVTVFNYPPDNLVVSETHGLGARFGLVPVGRGRVYWFAAANAPEGEHAATSAKAELLARFGGWHDPIKAIIQETPEESILRNDIYDRDPLKEWGVGRVSLLGDAAHPMTPDLGQGACQALEDAVVLATCLSTSDDMVAGLRLYEAKRRDRAAMIVRRSRQMGRLVQAANPLALRLRLRVMRYIPTGGLIHQMTPLLTFNPE